FWGGSLRTSPNWCWLSLLISLRPAPSPTTATPLRVRDQPLCVGYALPKCLPRLSRQTLRIQPSLRLLPEGLHVVAEAPAVGFECAQHAAGLFFVRSVSNAFAVRNVPQQLPHRVP